MINDKMTIRSVTYTINLDEIENPDYLKNVEDNIKVISNKYKNKDIRIRTIRFNVVAFDKFNAADKTTLMRKIELLSLFSEKIGVRWFNIAFNLVEQTKPNIDLVCETSFLILKEYKNSFVNLIVAKDYINNYAVIKASELIKEVSFLCSSGIDNFRLGVSLNPKQNTPFFPFSYSSENNSFSIAVESTKKIVNIIKAKFNHDYLDLSNRIIEGIKNDLLLIEGMSRDISSCCNIKYNGQDISLSPYPEENISVIEILNLLGVDNFGSNGTQFITSYLTSILKQAISLLDITAVGFNGVMYSLLEDKLMCKAHDSGNFTSDSIILYSTVCGCGLDMVPLPGDVLTEEIASMILDVATTSIKLNKPLGVRVLPIDNKKSKEMTDLTLDFLTNTLIPEVKHIHIDKRLFEITKFYVK